MAFVYLDESYVNKNHCLGRTWYHKDDPYGGAGVLPSGKGERLVMLTAITEEIGMIGQCVDKGYDDEDDVLLSAAEKLKKRDDRLASLLVFQARLKNKVDYHQNMNAECFCEWLERDLLKACNRYGISAILVMDNASYHCTPAEDSINVKSYTTKSQCTAILDAYNVPYRPGVAPRGDNLPQLKVILSDWLKAPSADDPLKTNAEAKGLMVNVTRVEALCKKWGWLKPIMTPPYHPELQPIERLWRDVKCYVARKYTNSRTVKELKEQVLEGFLKYGIGKDKSAGRMKMAFDWEEKFATEGVFAPVVDLTGYPSDDEYCDDAAADDDSETEDGYSSDDDDDSDVITYI